MPRTAPPYRADMVGSLLRPPALKQARDERERGAIDAAALAAIEDREIRASVKHQEAIGLQAVTDGEFRRAFWHFDFLEGLDGCEGYWMDHGVQFQGGVTLKPRNVRVVGKVGFSDHPMLQHFRFLAGCATRQPKMTIPSPSMLHYRGGRAAISREAYPELDAFYADLGTAYGQAIRAFYDAGCRYLQLDDVSLAYLCDPAQRRMLGERGDDPEHQFRIYRDMLNAATGQRPKDMAVTAHLCRGNFRSTFIAAGGYEPVADALFNQFDLDGYFLEWDNERSGGLEPLRYLPKGKLVVLGLVTSKTGQLESKDELKRRIDQAARFAPLEQLCLSPQCGFASTEEGNTLSEDEQWRKLERVVEVAREVWG